MVPEENGIKEFLSITGEVRCSICKKEEQHLAGQELPEGWTEGPSGPLCEECSLYISGLFGDALP